jgi:LDH2 family malate/lactate/ureidoglycolate dehydrogenase
VAEFKAAVDKLIRDLRASERMPGVEHIFMPGEQSHAKSAAQRKDGIALAPQLVQGLDRLAEQLDIPPLRTN